MEIGEKILLVGGADVALNRVEMDVFVRGNDGEWLPIGRVFRGCSPQPKVCVRADAWLVDREFSRGFNSRPWLRQRKGRAAN